MTELHDVGEQGGLVAIPPPAASFTPTQLPWRTAKEVAALTPDEPDWIVEHYLAVGAITDLSAKVKMGKTRLTLDGVAAVLKLGAFFGRATRHTSVVYLSEESASTFRQALRRAGLQDSVELHVLMRHEVRALKWPDIVEAAVAKCREVGALLLIIDTLPEWAGLRGDEENASGKALEAMQPLRDAAASGLAILMLRHDRKSGGVVGDSARGSSAFAGAADILLSLKPTDGKNRTTKRVLEAVGRYDGTPAVLTVDLKDGHYVAVGEGRVTSVQQAVELIRPLLPTDGTLILVADILGRHPELSKSTVEKAFKQLEADGSACVVPKQGMTKRANGYAAK